MDDDVVGDAKRALWWRRVRRSFDIPDLVTDQTAKAAIADRLLREFPLGLLASQERSVEVAQSIIDGVLDALAMGGFDRQLIGPEQNGGHATELVSKITGKALGGQRHGRGTNDGAAGIVGHLVKVVGESITALPFETMCGAYFGVKGVTSPLAP
jgi:hypothetical protein